MEVPINNDVAEEDDEDIEEIHVEPTDDGQVWLQFQDFDIYLSPEDARLLGQALIDTAADAEEGEE